MFCFAMKCTSEACGIALKYIYSTETYALMPQRDGDWMGHANVGRHKKHVNSQSANIKCYFTGLCWFS